MLSEVEQGNGLVMPPTGVLGGHELVRYLEAIGTGPITASDCHRLAELMKDFCSIVNLQTILVELSGDYDRLSRLAAWSYFHENNFAKLSLLTTRTRRFKVRLHCWLGGTSNSSAERNNVHNHRFDFYSYLLYGTLVNRTWIPRAEGEAYFHYRYQPRLDADRYSLDFVGVSELLKTEERLFNRGSFYGLESRALHTSAMLGGVPTATMFIEDRERLATTADVYTRTKLGHYRDIESPALTARQYIGILEEIVGHLEGDRHQAL